MATERNVCLTATRIVKGVVACVTVATLIVGVYEYRRTEILERDKEATDLFVKWTELMERSPQTEAQPTFYRDDGGVAIAEAIFMLERGDPVMLERSDPAWMATVDFMLGKHKEFLKKNLLENTYDHEFFEHVKKIASK